jgi:TolB protein
MQKFLRFILVAALAASASAAFAQRVTGGVTVIADSTIAVRITANSPELQSLALLAFSTHGAYDVTGRRKSAYDFKFTLAGGNQVRLDITRGGETAPAFSETVSGANARQALLKAADLAVVKTNTQKLRGYFSAKLAFVGERGGRKEIYFSDLFLGDMKQAQPSNHPAISPRWSPDGSKLIYTSFSRTGFPDILLYDLNSYQRSLFASYRGTNSGARFSPNGRQVAMVCSAQPEGTTEIYVGNASVPPNPARRTRSDAVKSSPCWSPDGSRLVFAMEPGPQLYVMPAGGGTPARIGSGFTYMAEPDWSRTSNKIACTVRTSNGYQIAVIEGGGGAAKVVSQAKFDAVEPSWLADGRHLVYTARDQRTSVICILDTETGRSTPLTTNFGNAVQASVWTPQ